MKKLLIVLALIYACTALPFIPVGMDAGRAEQPLVEGEVLPELKGQTLSGKDLTLPADVKGKPTVLGLAFSQKAEGDLKGWVQPFYDNFLAKHEGVFEAGNFTGNVYIAAVLSGATASLAGKGMLDKAAKNTDAELRPHILVSKQDPAALVKAIGASDKNKPYFVVLDSKGQIQSIVSGTYSEAKMDELVEKAEAAE